MPGPPARRASEPARRPPTGRGRRPGVRRPPRTPAPPSTVSESTVAAHDGAEAGEQLLELRADLGGGIRPAVDRDACRRRPARRPGTGAAFDRSGSMVDVARRDRRGGHHPDAGLGVLDRRPRARRARRSSSRCAAGSAGARRCGAASSPRAKRGAASSSPDTNWLEADASIASSPPSTAPGAVDRERHACPRRRRPRRRPRSRSAWIVVRIGRRRALGVAVDRDRSEGERRDRRQEAHDGAGEPGVDRVPPP